MVDPRILTHLQAKGVPFAAIGALALAVHGASRFSADADLLVMDPGVLIESFWKGCGQDEYEIRCGDEEDPLAGVVRFRALLPVDVVVGRGRVFRYALDTAQPNAQISCPVASPLGLALLKLEAGGPKDLQDLLMLQDAQKALTGWGLLQAVEGQQSLLGPHGKRTWELFKNRFGVDPAGGYG